MKNIDKALEIQLQGIVQGVGMRPHVYRLAMECEVNGWVFNSAAGVQIHIEGEAGQVDAFARRLLAEAPPLALITKCRSTGAVPQGYESFEIRKSASTEAIRVMVSPDISTCQDCRDEVSDPADRRYGYAFTNCTNCGPRFTIIRDLPYDRANTTMAAFPMCPLCEAEYNDPRHRRFHAQPNACPQCGPRLQLLDPDGHPVNQDADVKSLLKAGKIVAVKGLGGFHLAVDARNGPAVQRLRTRKKRDAKPFALMARDLKAAARYSDFSDMEAGWLQSARAPIVILKSRNGRWGEHKAGRSVYGEEEKGVLAHELIHPGLPTVGIMLPYTPLHLLMFDDDLDILVMTSANISDEPLIVSNEEALDKLRGIADAFLFHDRDIENPCDDSVVILTELGELQFFRRARGFVPQGIALPFSSSPVLGAGPEMKNSFSVVREDQVYVSQHWGDLNHYLNYNRYREGLERFTKMLDVSPVTVAFDIHPEYQATRWARSQKHLDLLEVQHHWAHLASVMAEHGLNEPVLGLICDGTGMGVDGQIWGCEILAGDYQDYQRLGHLDYIAYPGGDLNARRPYRMAAIYLQKVLGDEGIAAARQFMPDLSEEEAGWLAYQLSPEGKPLLTSSCGRLFDAVSAFLGICPVSRYDGQAAVELEAVADPGENGYYPYRIEERQGQLFINVEGIWRGLAEDRLGGDIGRMSRRFHNSLVLMFSEALHQARLRTGLDKVVLSGGVFHNQLLLVGLYRALVAEGFEVYINQAVPPGDGGVSLGQAAIAAYRCQVETAPE